MAYPKFKVTIPQYGWEVEYYEMTEGESMEMQAAIRELDTDSMKEILTGMIANWNCTDRNGRPLLVSSLSLEKLPESAIKIIVNALLSPEKQSGSLSDPKAVTSSSQPIHAADEAREEERIPV